jgi:hypothetical protein
MEVEWVADRATLRSLAREHPKWTQQDLADAVGRSLSWVKNWKQWSLPPAPLLLSGTRGQDTVARGM